MVFRNDNYCFCSVLQFGRYNPRHFLKLWVILNLTQATCECLQLCFHREHHCVCAYRFAGGKTGFRNVTMHFGALHKIAVSFLNYLMMGSWLTSNWLTDHSEFLCGFNYAMGIWLSGSTILCFCCLSSSEITWVTISPVGYKKIRSTEIFLRSLMKWIIHLLYIVNAIASCMSFNMNV